MGLRTSVRLAAVGFLGSAALFMFVFIGALTASPASAATVCSGTLNGQDLASASTPDDAIDLPFSATVPVSGTDSAIAANQQMNYRVEMTLNLLGDTVSWTVASGTTTGGHWVSAVKVSKYAVYGAGLYWLDVSASSVTGGDTCSGGGFIDVKGSGLPDAEIGGIALAGVGVVGAAAAGLAAAGSSGVSSAPSNLSEEEAANKELDELPGSPMDKFVHNCSLLSLLAIPLTFGAVVWELLRAAGHVVRGIVS